MINAYAFINKLCHHMSILKFWFLIAFLLIALCRINLSQGAVSTNVAVNSYGAISYPKTNLAPIPDGWYLQAYPPDPAYAFLDYNIYRTSAPSIRIEQDYLNNDRAIFAYLDGQGATKVQPGDRIYFSCWIKTDPLAGYTHDPTKPWLWKGGRIGIDFYALGADGNYFIVDSYPHEHEEAWYSYVEWGTSTWTQRVWDITVPSGKGIVAMAIWMQVIGYTDAANAWFADAELYINP